MQARGRWDRLRDSVLAKNTLWVAAGQVLRVGIQAVYFVLIARALGSREYGAYVGVVAVVAIASPFASLGSGNLLIKHVARNPSGFPQHWGKALATTLLSGTLLLGLVTFVARLWLPASITLLLVLVVGAADLLFVRLVDVGAQAYQAHQWLSRTAVLQLLVSPLRLLAAILLAAQSTAPTALEWGVLYLVSAALGSVVAILLVNSELGRPEFHFGRVGSELREGLFFSVSLSAQSATNDIDKAMLGRLASLEATGVYAAAYRLVDVAFLPIGSLLGATYTRFFQHGVHGIRATARFARQLLGLAAGYGLVASAALYFLAPAVTAILGDEYREGIAAIRWLAVLPLLKAVHYFGADALTGAGYQGVRTVVQVSIALVNVLLNLWLIPHYSWRGAAVATIASDGLMAAVIWATVWHLGRHRRRLKSPDDAPSVAEVG
jgi:O-antigen/teichoic acid export membrane protein